MENVSDVGIKTWMLLKLLLGEKPNKGECHVGVTCHPLHGKEGAP